MAVKESKRSLSSAQPTRTPTPKHRSSKRATAKPNRKKRDRTPASLRFTVTKRGKTTIRRYPGRSFHRFEEAKGKALDYRSEERRVGKSVDLGGSRISQKK